MKVYVVTSLIESQDEGAEVNVLGIKKTKNEAYLLMTKVLQEAKNMYEENDLDYEIKQYNDETIVIYTSYEGEYNGLERIEYNIIESEVE